MLGKGKKLKNMNKGCVMRKGWNKRGKMAFCVHTQALKCLLPKIPVDKIGTICFFPVNIKTLNTWSCDRLSCCVLHEVSKWQRLTLKVGCDVYMKDY